MKKGKISQQPGGEIILRFFSYLTLKLLEIYKISCPSEEGMMLSKLKRKIARGFQGSHRQKKKVCEYRQ